MKSTTEAAIAETIKSMDIASASLPFLFFVIGPTNVGKSTFLQTLAEQLKKSVHLVEVGKQMRAKYSPEHFKGQANPKHTEAEALQMLFSGIEEGDKKGVRFILIDGQPRDADQANEIMDHFADRRKAVIQLTCPRVERERRARTRERNNPAAVQLSLDRMDRDVLQLYEVLIRLDDFLIPIFNRNTNGATYSPYRAFRSIVEGLVII